MFLKLRCICAETSYYYNCLQPTKSWLLWLYCFAAHYILKIAPVTWFTAYFSLLLFVFPAYHSFHLFTLVKIKVKGTLAYFSFGPLHTVSPQGVNGSCCCHSLRQSQQPGGSEGGSNYCCWRWNTPEDFVLVFFWRRHECSLSPHIHLYPSLF